jgi:CRP-like cAMP-binding protein
MNADDREKTCLPLLAELPLFQGLAPEALRFLAGGCHQRTAPKGLVVCEKGSRPDGLFLVTKGRIKLAVLSEDGSERVLDIVLPGRSFAEAAAFLGEPCLAYAETLCESRLLYLAQQRLREAVIRWPEVAFVVIARLARQVYDLTRDLEACCLRTAAQRVASYLLREATDDCSDADGAEVVLPAAKVVVASSLHLTAETFSRELHDLARNGIVDVERRTVRVRSLQQLRLRAGATC